MTDSERNAPLTEGGRRGVMKTDAHLQRDVLDELRLGAERRRRANRCDRQGGRGHAHGPCSGLCQEAHGRRGGQTRARRAGRRQRNRSPTERRPCAGRRGYRRGRGSRAGVGRQGAR